MLGDAQSFQCRSVTGGPDKLSNGLIFTCVPEPGGTDPRCGYFPDAQAWNEVQSESGETLYWLGMETDNPPTPEDVIRKKTIDGHPVELEDGNTWSIPAVHYRLTTIPKKFVVGPKGDVYLEAIDGYKELTHEADWWWDILQAEGSYELERYFNYATNLLNVNYRLGKHEISMLGLLADRQEVNEFGVVGASLGLQGLEADTESIKKKVSIPQDGSGDSSGDEASTMITSQPTAT